MDSSCEACMLIIGASTPAAIFLWDGTPIDIVYCLIHTSNIVNKIMAIRSSFHIVNPQSKLNWGTHRPPVEAQFLFKVQNLWQLYLDRTHCTFYWAGIISSWFCAGKFQVIKHVTQERRRWSLILCIFYSTSNYQKNMDMHLSLNGVATKKEYKMIFCGIPKTIKAVAVSIITINYGSGVSKFTKHAHWTSGAELNFHGFTVFSIFAAHNFASLFSDR